MILRYHSTLLCSSNWSKHLLNDRVQIFNPKCVWNELYISTTPTDLTNDARVKLVMISVVLLFWAVSRQLLGGSCVKVRVWKSVCWSNVSFTRCSVQGTDVFSVCTCITTLYWRKIVRHTRSVIGLILHTIAAFVQKETETFRLIFHNTQRTYYRFSRHEQGRQRNVTRVGKCAKTWWHIRKLNFNISWFHVVGSLSKHT